MYFICIPLPTATKYLLFSFAVNAYKMYNICLYFANGSCTLALLNIVPTAMYTNKNANFTTEKILSVTENKILHILLFLLYLFQVAEMTLWIMMMNNSPRKVRVFRYMILINYFIVFIYGLYSCMVQMCIDCYGF